MLLFFAIEMGISGSKRVSLVSVRCIRLFPEFRAPKILMTENSIAVLTVSFFESKQAEGGRNGAGQISNLLHRSNRALSTKFPVKSCMKIY